MICHQLKLIFVHPPKTAGHSVESAFMEYLNIPWADRRELLLGTNTDPRYGPPILDHLTAHQYRAFGYVSRGTWQSYLKVGTARNPWGRLLSEWRFRKIEVSFKDWLMMFFPPPAWNDEYVHVIDQTEFLGLGSPYAVQRIIRFENLQDEFASLCEFLSIPPLELPHRRASAKTGSLDYRDWYDAEMRERVEERYHEDIKRLGYSFDTGE